MRLNFEDIPAEDEGETEPEDTETLKARILAELGFGKKDEESEAEGRLTLSDLSDAVQKGMQVASRKKPPEEVAGEGQRSSFFNKMVGPFPVWGIALGAVGAVAAVWLIGAMLRLRDYEQNR